MINYWTDNRLIKDLLQALRRTRGYSVVKAVPWGWYRVLKDGKGSVIYEAKSFTRGQLIATVVNHYDQGTNP